MAVASIIWANGFGSGNENWPSDAQSAIWFAWCLIMDTGTHTGVPSSDSWGIKAFAALATLFGLLLNLILMGFVIDTLRAWLERHRKMHNRKLMFGHTLILGWTEKTLFILREILMLPDPPKSVLILGEADKYGPDCPVLAVVSLAAY